MAPEDFERSKQIWPLQRKASGQGGLQDLFTCFCVNQRNTEVCEVDGGRPRGCVKIYCVIMKAGGSKLSLSARLFKVAFGSSSGSFWATQEEQRNQIKLLEQELDDDQHGNATGLLAPLADQPILMAVAGGIGASVGNTGSINFDRAGGLATGCLNHGQTLTLVWVKTFNSPFTCYLKKTLCLYNHGIFMNVRWYLNMFDYRCVRFVCVHWQKRTAFAAFQLFHQDLIHRMKMQDLVVMCLLMSLAMEFFPKSLRILGIKMIQSQRKIGIKVVQWQLRFVYFATLSFSACLAHRQARKVFLRQSWSSKMGLNPCSVSQ